MKEHPYLTFTLKESVYGIDTFAVEEIFFLPELTPIPEAPRDIIGVVNVRGEILPVMDINIRFGYQGEEYNISDSVIVLKSGDLRVGIIVNEVQDVKNIEEDSISSEISIGRDSIINQKRKFIAGIARKEENIIIILDSDNLINYIEKQNIDQNTAEVAEYDSSEDHLPLEKKRIFCANATPEERQIYQQRAESLRQTAETEERDGYKPLAIVALDNEFFGMDLSIVREFTEITQLTPIPCCPHHIIGNMNLRGEILTLVDIRNLLNLSQKDMGSKSQAIVVQVDDIVAGIKVEDVVDVMFLNPQDVTSVPTALHALNNDYLQGTAPYSDRMMTILDLPKILLSSSLTVDEAV